MKKIIGLTLAGALLSGTAYAASLTVPVKEATTMGDGAALGEVVISETPYGLLFTPKLHGLAPGVHGFHVHENASCLPGPKRANRLLR
ncbi:Superoxide dismutase [Cu-Zn] 1 precursor [Edwardsiella tarda]|nr:Superoxide dismutase [Cu-Zn] 1 precursor [Edwardsiella tarda]